MALSTIPLGRRARSRCNSSSSLLKGSLPRRPVSLSTTILEQQAAPQARSLSPFLSYEPQEPQTVSILTELRQRQPKSDPSPVLSVRVSHADREKLRLIQNVLSSHGVYSPTKTDAVRWALEKATETTPAGHR